MLPDAAAVTGDEQASVLLRLRISFCKSFAQRWTRIILLAANASRDLLFVCNVFVGIDSVFGSFGFFGLLGALAAAGWVAGVFAGEGVGCCGLLGVVQAYAAAVLAVG